MKARKWLWAGLCAGLSVSFFYSCRKDSVSNPAQVSTVDTNALFSATIAGVYWQTDSVAAILVNEFPHHEKIITINGYTSNKVISISLKDTSFYTSDDSTILAAQYTAGNWDKEAAFGYFSGRMALGRDSVWKQQGAAENGQVTVTASDGVNKTISGGFSFTARVFTIDSLSLSFDTVNVSNGVFKNIPYGYRH